MEMELSTETLAAAMEGEGVAIRRVQRMMPGGGPGDKVFPPTYENGVYAEEDRIIDGQKVPCVLLDSVQSQANRMEMALKETFYHGLDKEAAIPIIVVDFTSAGLPEVGEITSLDVPHRLADAILRDSLLGNVSFVQSELGKVLSESSSGNATGLYEICPTALIFGLWDSTGVRGGLGVKFQRTMVSEIVAINAVTGVRPSSRIDPLGIVKDAGPIYKAGKWQWELTQEAARRISPDNNDRQSKKGKKVGDAIDPSEVNHGNVTPSLKEPGGVTFAFAQQSVVISMPALRRLRFPGGNGQRDLAARTALTALAIAGAELSIRKGCDLRSRCLLVPDPDFPTTWEILRQDGTVQKFKVPDPVYLLAKASEWAVSQGLPAWRRLPWRMNPRPALVELVRKSRKLLEEKIED